MNLLSATGFGAASALALGVIFFPEFGIPALLLTGAGTGAAVNIAANAQTADSSNGLSSPSVNTQLIFVGLIAASLYLNYRLLKKS